MPLRVLQLGPYPPPEGGISRNMLAIRDELHARGHHSSIIATSKSSRIDDEPNVYHPRSAFGLLRLLSSLKYDVLHLHLGGDVNRRVVALAAACSFFGRNKSILTLHSGEYPLTKNSRKASPKSIRGRIFQKFSHIIAVNDAIADVFHRYDVSSERVKVILPYSLRQPDERVQVPPDLSNFYAQYSPVLLSVGGLERDYDPMFQIAAMREILDEFPNAGLVIVGDGSMRADAEAAIAKSEYANNIFLAGNVDHAVTLHLINDADVFLRTTLFDGDAISVREAVFLGTPVIATNIGKRPDDVHLIDIGDKNALAQAIKDIVSAKRRKEVAGSPENENISAVVDLYEEQAALI